MEQTWLDVYLGKYKWYIHEFLSMCVNKGFMKLAS